MKQVFSCSDFLNDLWQNSSEIPDTLQGLQSPDEGGSTRFHRETSADMLGLLEPQEAESLPSFGAFTACSTSGRDPQGLFTTDQNNGNQRQSPTHSLLQDAFMQQPASSTLTRAFDTQDMQPLPKRARTMAQAAFPMDTAKQAKAICHNGASITALQQQLQDLKGHPSLDLLAHRNQPSVSTALQEAQPQMVPSLMLQGASDAANPAPSPLSSFPPTAATQQPPLGLQQHQLRQLAQLLGTANVSALQNMAVPSVSQVVPDVAGSSIRMPGSQLQECATSSAPGMSHSSGDDDTGALGDLHNLAGLGDDGEEAWEHKLDKNLPPPEMKRMRRMLSNRESARRSRRRKQAHMQDLEVQNNELVEVNDKLQKEVTALRNMAKEAALEKNKAQAALEAFKHQVVHVLGEHNIMLTKDISPQDQAQQAQQAPAGTADSAGSESMQLVNNTVGSGSPSSNAPLVAKAAGNGRATHKLVKAPSSPCKVGSKRKACDV